MTDQFAQFIGPVARLLLGEPNQQQSTAKELRYGSRGSFAVNLTKGVWHDHESEEGGGLLDLIVRETRCPISDAPAWLKDHGFELDDERPKSNGPNGKKPQRHIDKIFPYADLHGTVLFEVVRYNPKDFRQRQPDGKGGHVWSLKGVQLVPYKLPEIAEAIALGHTIFVVEGEKCADLLWSLGIPATCNPMGAGKWTGDLNQYFAGADVVVIPDFDPQKKNQKGELVFHDDGRPVLAGQDHALAVAAALNETAARVRVLDLAVHWHQIKSKQDIADWFAVPGHTVDLFHDLVDHAVDWAPELTLLYSTKPNVLTVVYPFPIDETTIPVRDWLVPGLLMRRQVTVLVAPSGSGKSLLTLQLGIACARHKAWSGWLPRKPLRVMVINSEDDIDEMRRRLAAAARVMVSSKSEQQEMHNNVVLVDNADGAVVAKFDAKTKTMIATPLLEQIIATIKANEIDIIFVDPFAETFEGDENSNSELKWAGVLWRQVARLTGAAVCLVHHTKKYATGMAGDVDAARGAGALIGIARIVSTLFPMTTREAEAMGVEDDKRGLYLRYDDAKANLNIKSPIARWFFKQTVTLDNKTDELPGDDVGVLIPWKPIGPSVLEDQIIKFFTRIDRGIIDQADVETGEFYSFNSRSGDRWVVKFAQEFFEIASEVAAAKLIEGWRRDKRLESVPHRSARQRKARARVISELDQNAPKNRKARAAGQPQEQQDELDYDATRKV